MALPVFATTVTTCMDSSSCENGPLKPDVFPSFSLFLDASQEYARISGCRFRSRDVQSRDARRAFSLGDIDQAFHRPAAKVVADSVVLEFATRVRLGEAELAKDLKRAYRQVAEEGVRNAMVATCRRLELWPPTPASIESCLPRGINKLPVIAQDLYEEEMERLAGEEDRSRRMRTAAFLADFADAVGMAQSPMPEQQAKMFQQFNELAERWEQDTSKLEADPIVSILVSDHDLLSILSIACEAEHIMF